MVYAVLKDLQYHSSISPTLMFIGVYMQVSGVNLQMVLVVLVW